MGLRLCSLSSATFGLSCFRIPSLSWTETIVQHIITILMTPQSAFANAAGNPQDKLLPNPKARLKDQFHEVARFKHLSPRSETAYWEWIVR